MDGILRERVRVALVKVEIALGLDVNCGEMVNHPNIDRAMQVLDDLRQTMHEPDDDTPLELLGLSSTLCTHLRTAGINSVEELVSMTDDDLMALDHIRAGRIREIDFHLHRCGLKRV